MLYRFHRPNSQVSHYIFGTLHLSTDAAYAHALKARNYMMQTSAYIAEMDLSSDKSPLAKYMMLPEGEKNSDHWGEKKFNKYKHISKKAFGINLAEMDVMIPFYIQNRITEAVVHNKYHQPLDYYLWLEATMLEKELLGLETLEEQIQILNQIPLDYQYKMLQNTFKNTKSFRKNILRIETLYRKSQTDELFRTTKKTIGRIRKMMLYDRNIIMAERIDSLCQSQSIFVSVGAAHLSGNKGVIALLSRQGYKFQAV